MLNQWFLAKFLLSRFSKLRFIKYALNRTHDVRGSERSLAAGHLMPENIPAFPYEEIPTEWLYSILGFSALFVAVILFLQVYCLKYALRICGAGERGFLFSAFGIFIVTIVSSGTSVATGILRPSSTPLEIVACSISGAIGTYSILFWINPLRAFAVYLVHSVTSLFSVVAATAVFIFGGFAIIPEDAKNQIMQVSSKYGTEVRAQLAKHQGNAFPSAEQGTGGFMELLNNRGLSEITNVKAPSNAESASSFDAAGFFFNDTLKSSLEAAHSPEPPSIPTYESSIKKNPFFKPSN